MSELQKSNSVDLKSAPKRRLSLQPKPMSFDAANTSGSEDIRALSVIRRALDNFMVYYSASELEPSNVTKDSQSTVLMNRLLVQIGHLVNKNNRSLSSVIDILANEKLIKNFTNILTYCFVYLRALLSKAKTNSLDSSPHSVESFHKVYDFLVLLVQLIWGLTNFSIKFRKTFHHSSGSKILLNFLSDPNFTDHLILFNVKSKLFDFSDENYELMKAIIGSLHNLTKTSRFEKGLKATHVLISFVHKIKSSQLKINLISVYMTLAHILTDKEIDEMADIFEIVEKLVRIINAAAEQIEAGSECVRVKVDIENDRVESVCAVSDDDEIKWDLVELMSGLYRIAVNDKIKYYIYVNCDFKKIIYKILTHGNVIEKEFTMRILYQMSFDERICEIATQDNHLIELVAEVTIESEKNPSSKKLHEYCNGVNWILDNKFNKTLKSGDSDKELDSSKTVNESADNNIAPISDQAVVKPKEAGAEQLKLMISYNRENRDLCLKMKKSLEALNFKIWIDVEQIHGSSLEAMAKAIEESDAIIICKLLFYF
jgi:hypothetical protein